MSKKSLLHDRSFLSKQVPKSTKYSHVGPSVDTGSSTLNHLRKLRDNHVPHKYLDNELFVRLKPILLGRLIYETQMEVDVSAVEDAVVARMTSTSHASTASSTPAAYAGGGGAGSRPIYSRNHPHPMHSADSVGALMTDRPMPPTSTTSTPYPYSATPTPHSHYEPLISGPINGTRSLLTASHASMLSAPGQHGQRLNRSADSGYDSRLPYLLLDVREASAWAKCHIVGAVPYPSVFIKRDQMSRDMVMYRNREDKVVVLYDDDESLAVPAAQTLGERGFTNVYVLSGGLNHFVERISGILIGSPPTPPKLQTRASTCSSSSTTSLPKIASASISASAPASRPRPSSLTAAASAAMPATNDGLPPQTGVFNMHDLERSLQYHALRSVTPAPGSRLASRASSRMSVASTLYSGSNATGVATTRRSGAGGGGMVAAATEVGRGRTSGMRAAVGNGVRGPSKLGRS